MSSAEDFTKLSVVQLKAKLKSRGLTVSGTKAELITRLVESFTAEERILNEAEKDDDVTLTESESVNEDEVLGLTSPPNHEETVAKEDTLLKAAGSSRIEWNPVKDDKVDGEASKTDSRGTPDAVNPKLRRAQRFGIPLSDETLKRNRRERFGAASAATPVPDDEKKRMRMIRFGIGDGKKGGTNNEDPLRKRALRFELSPEQRIGAIGKVDPPSVEQLAKRAKRFGTMTEKAEIIMRMQKRAERFGGN